MKMSEGLREEYNRDSLKSGMVFTCPIGQCGMKFSSWNYPTDHRWQLDIALHVLEKHVRISRHHYWLLT